MSEEGKRHAAELVAQLQTMKAQRDDLASALRDVIGWVPGDAAWHTRAPRDAVERARALLSEVAR